jgi:hypothetical protein
MAVFRERPQIQALINLERGKFGLVYETFGTPALDPEIELRIPEEFDYVKEFGTKGDEEKSRYKEVHKLSGVYFPGRYMLVQWWPKKPAHGSATVGAASTRLPMTTGTQRAKHGHED